MTTYARALYPGIAQIQSVTAVFGHGITPSGFRVTIAPQPSNVVIETGTFRLEYNDQAREFPDCRVDQASFRLDGRGQLIEVTILDRRWRWKLGRAIDGQNVSRLDGEYNVRREDGTIKKIDGGNPALAIEDPERTAEQLARLCLEAAGEPIANDALNALPPDVRPYVSWDAANPFDELQALAEAHDCRVVLCADNLVRIRRVNIGLPLPRGRVMSYGGQSDYFDAPDGVSLVTGWVRFQHDFELECVGLDVDGNWKLLDDLSYRPAGGWEASDIFTRWVAIDEAPTQNLALETVFRCYRVKVPFDLPGFGQITRREQLILLGSQIFQMNIDGTKVDRPAMVYGIYYRMDDAAAANSGSSIKYLPDNSVEGLRADDERVAQIVRIGFSIDAETCIVRFGELIFADEGADQGRWVPATLRLRTTCYARYVDTGRIQRYEYPRQLRNAVRPVVEDLLHDEIKPHVWAIYDNTFAVAALNTNEADLFPEIDRYLQDAADHYAAPVSPEAAEYGGWILDLDLDGAIQSITWTLAATQGGDPRTRIDRNHDSGHRGIPYQNRRIAIERKRLKREVAKREWSAKRQAEIDRINQRAPG